MTLPRDFRLPRPPETPEAPRVVVLPLSRIRRRGAGPVPAPSTEPRRTSTRAQGVVLAFPASRRTSPFPKPLAPAPAGTRPALPRRLARHWRRIVALDLPPALRHAPPLDRIHATDWIDLPASALALCHDDDLDRDTLVLSPLYASRLDPLEIARQLQSRGFPGLYAALGTPLPDPRLVAGELARQAPVVDFLPLDLGVLSA